MFWKLSHILNTTHWIRQGCHHFFSTCKIWSNPRFHLRSLLFVTYVNDLPNFFNISNSLMFAGDRNLFFWQKYIKVLFKTVKKKLEKLKWILHVELYLNIGKSFYFFFHQTPKKDDLPLFLPKLEVGNIDIISAKARYSYKMYKSSTFS